MNATPSPVRFAGAKLSAMMFLEFFIWGAWYVTCGNYMVAHRMGSIIHWAYTVGPVMAILSPFFLGLVADRFFATERVLGTMHLLGGAAMLGALVAGGDHPLLFLACLFLHMACFMPTLGLTNALALHHLPDAEKQFPLVRVFGTLGWIVANVVVSRGFAADAKPLQFLVAALGCAALGIGSFALPHTPPPAAGKPIRVREIVGLDALRQLSGESFWVFLASSLLVCIPLAAYYAFAPVFVSAMGFPNPAFTMSFGQMSEVFFMLVMPLCFARLGVKWMLAVGMLAWVARYALFALGAPSSVAWMVLGGILLHGVCYDFFFVTGFIYIDQKATREIRAQAQGLLVLVTQGIGMLVGAQVSGALHNVLVRGEGASLLANYRAFWMVPCLASAVVLGVFLLLFHEDGRGGREA